MLQDTQHSAHLRQHAPSEKQDRASSSKHVCSAPQNMLLCMGTRPEIIKMAPVHHALQAAGLKSVVFHTGQHQEVAQPLYRLFGIKPGAQVTSLERKGGSLAELGAALLEESHHALQAQKPDAVLVHGDTSSALYAALAAFYLHIPIGHVEAGLRTHDTYNPFPEEMNRTLIARMAKWHFAPTAGARLALMHEGIAPQAIYQVGNTAVDAALEVAERTRQNPALVDWPASLQGFTPSDGPQENAPKLILVTAHRRENWGVGITQIAQAVCTLIAERADSLVVWPVHPNPQVRDAVMMHTAEARKRYPSRLLLCDPLDYAALVTLLKQAWLVLTDSGGIQEEAAAFGVPVLVLRETTERPELIEQGGGKVIGTKPQAILNAALPLMHNAQSRATLVARSNPFGDGKAAQRIADVLATGAVQIAWS
jgi:UDP-N-acetylglucosamine 2-epimerase (non-hydrolysing)